MSRLRIYKVEDSEAAASRDRGIFTKNIPQDTDIKALSFDGISYSLVCIEPDNHSTYKSKTFQWKKSGDKVDPKDKYIGKKITEGTFLFEINAL